MTLLLILDFIINIVIMIIVGFQTEERGWVLNIKIFGLIDWENLYFSECTEISKECG